MNKHTIVEANVSKILDWFANRGGLAVWQSINLSNPGASWTGPLNDADGKPSTKPNWQCGNEPVCVITDPADVVVEVPKEVKRFHVAIRMGSQGMSYKLTDGSSRRVRAAVAKAGDGAWYEFDYGTQEAVIYVAGDSKPLTEYKERQDALHG